MAQWLFCPEFMEYRGGFYRADSFSSENVDNWLRNRERTVPVVEEVTNRVKLWDVFGSCQLDGLERNLEELAESLAVCWRGALAARFPDRRFVVLADDTANGVYGPGVTFFQDDPVQP